MIAACASLGLTAEQIGRGMRRFAGVRRRQEVRGVAQGVTVVDDFAHHPTAVRETLRALRRRHGGGRLIAIFEPRSATSRRAVFQKEFAEAFAEADETIVGAVSHPEKAPAGDRFDAERLAADLRGKGVAARHVPSVDQIVEQVAANAAAGDTVVIMTSGGFEGIHDKLLSRLGDAVVPARPEDLPSVRALLDRTELAYPELEDHVGDLLVVRDGARAVVGCVALELYDEAGLLRSLATAPERRGEGLGWMLADAALGRARSRGCRRVYLITESASDFFAEKFGFRAVQLVDGRRRRRRVAACSARPRRTRPRWCSTCRSTAHDRAEARARRAARASLPSRGASPSRPAPSCAPAPAAATPPITSAPRSTS